MKSLLFLSICVFFLLLAGDLHLIQAGDDDHSNANFLSLPGSEVAAIALAPTNIIGRDGLCLDVTNGTYVHGTPIQLWPCSKNHNQLWTFEGDGTIRSNGKCMTISGDSFGSYAMICECDSFDIRSRWDFNDSGTITNIYSGLVLSSLNATKPEGLPVTLEMDLKRPFQAWTAVNYTKPVVTYISSGFSGYCFLADNPKNLGTYLFARCCLLHREPRQQWALYGDKTIRLFSDRALCVTSSNELLTLNRCQGLPTQWWNFLPDVHISSPSTGLYIKVEGESVYNRPLAANPRQQEWYTLACPDCPNITF